MNSHAINCQLRILASFCGATENEIAVDRMIYEVAGISPTRLGFLPRPSKWINYGRRFPSFIYSLWWVARWVWVFGGSYVFFFCQFLPAWFRARRINENQGEILKDSGYVLALSSRVGDIVHSGHVEDVPCTWITMPWAPLTRIPADAKYVDIFLLLNKADIWLAFLDAIFATRVLQKRKRTSPWILQSYTAFHWFAVRIAVDKLPGRLLIAEHFDRWAVLVDSSVQAKKYRLNPTSQARRRDLTVVQHGALGNLGENNRNGVAPKLQLHRRLRAVSQICVYNTQAEHAFKTDVLSPACVRRGINVSYYRPGLDLRVDHEYTGLKILFVGHVLCEELHRHIFNSLAKEYEFRAYYKPHPTSPMSHLMRSSPWKIISDVGYFPVVDLLVSYPSTLVVEYAGAGIPAMVHPMNLAMEKSGDFLESIRASIQILRKSLN